MPKSGSGRLDDLCRYVLEQSKGDAAVLIVVESSEAMLSATEDFCVAGANYHVARLPKVLRRIADEIEKASG